MSPSSRVPAKLQKSSIFKLLIGLLLASLLFTSTPAFASQQPSSGGPDSISAINDARYSDAEILEVLFAGQGPVADDNPELIKYLGFSADRPMTDPEALSELVHGFLAYYPAFSEEVRTPLQSGNPRLVEASLMQLTKVYQKYAAATYGIKPSGAKAAAAGDCGKTWVCGYVTALAVANAGIYATVGVATFVLAAAAAVFVVGPVAYLDDKNGPETRVTALEKDEITLRIASSLAQAR